MPAGNPFQGEYTFVWIKRKFVATPCGRFNDHFDDTVLFRTASVSWSWTSISPSLASQIDRMQKGR